MSEGRARSIVWDREYRLWARCPLCDQHPDGLEIKGTYVRFASALRIGQREYGFGMFHVDHIDPEHDYTGEEQSLTKPSFNGNGKHKSRGYAGPYAEKERTRRHEH